jgi:hypothetical protein
MQQPKKIFLGFTYTRSQAESRYNFGKDQGLARRKEKKERVTPEFGEWRKEKNQLQNQCSGVTVRWCVLTLALNPPSPRLSPLQSVLRWTWRQHGGLSGVSGLQWVLVVFSGKPPVSCLWRSYLLRFVFHTLIMLMTMLS